jgi:HEAT repeat protein
VSDNRDALEAVVRHAALLDDDDYDDIAPALDALSACGDISLVPRLREALGHFLDDRNFYGRDLIARVLAGIQGVAALPALLGALARDIGDDQDSLQAEIVDLLKADRERARRTVLAFATGNAPELRLAGLWALGYVAGAQDLDLLAAAASDADPAIRSVAVGAIPGHADDDRAFGVLVSAAGDFVDQVRVSAASGLGCTGRPDAVPHLAALATDPARRVRSMAAYALGQLGRAEAAGALVRLLRDPDGDVREQAVRALGGAGGPAAVDALLALAAEADPRRRSQAAAALAAAAGTDPRAWPQVMMLARDQDGGVRAATLSGTADTAGLQPEWAQLVAGLADDPDPVVRRRVAVTVRHLAPDAARDILTRYATDRDQRVRQVASTALGRLAGH